MRRNQAELIIPLGATRTSPPPRLTKHVVSDVAEEDVTAASAERRAVSVADQEVRLLGEPTIRIPVVQRTVINPWQWSVQMGFNQGEVVEGASRMLFCAGQTSVDENGTPQHAGDMGGQVALARDNLEAVLRQGGMGLGNVVRLNIYTTDVEALFANYGTAAERFAAAGVAPPGTLLGVARLAFPELMVELEATAVA